jgi:Flp pilus assembly protein TadG
MNNLRQIGCRRIRRSKGERGSYIIESGLCFVLFFIILLGVLDVGRGIYSYNFVSASSKEPSVPI